MTRENFTDDGVRKISITREEPDMNAQSKKSIGSTMLLLIFGIAAVYGGPKWLPILIPAAILVCYAAAPLLRTSRN